MYKIHEIQGHIQSNYIIEYQDKILLMDCATKADLKKIRKYIDGELGRKMEDIKLAVVSHMHPDHAGLALTYHEESAAPGVYKRCIYVGLGDFEGFDDRNDKSQTIVEYDLDDNSFRTVNTPYTGGICSGAVSFTIGSKAYVGTGSGESPKYTWHVFDPVAEFDGDDINTPGWRTINIPGGIEVGRTGAIAFSINDRGYFGLGKDASGNFLNDFWEFRPDPDGYDGAWFKKADFPGEKRQNAAAFVIGTQGFVGTGDNIIGDMEGGSYTGQTFSDVYRYDPFNNKWTETWTDGDINVRDYTLAKEGNPLNPNFDNPKHVTRTCGFSGSTYDYGFIGFGMMPEEAQRAQEDYWKYQPWETGAAR